MNDPNLEDFLAGTADDQQHRACEELLSNPETVINCQPTLGDDSLISALRLAGENPPTPSEIDSLVEQVEKLVPNRAVSYDELKQVLDPSGDSSDLGMIDRFHVIEFLASGGMGLVFRAIDPNLDRDVCIKLLNPKLKSDSESKRRFERESREASRMQSARIVAILEVGNQKGLPFLVMPMLEGASLRSVLDRYSTIPPDLALKITRQIAQGLEHAHNRNLLHRDIKPDNLWLTPTNDIIILDFGLARSTERQFENEAPVTRHGTIIGTPSYMSPEQVTGKALDQRSDLFSVGVVFVEMLTGESPFKKSNLFSTMMSVAGEKLELDEIDSMQDIPTGMQYVAENLLKKNPDERIGSASDLIETIDRIEKSPNIAIGKKKPRHRVRGWGRAFAASIAGVLVTLALIAFLSLNDKGTLVVSTNDPDVEVRVAKEIVSVFDPVTERKYKIRIGETPLPSGIYQLESDSPDGGLSFSSQTIVIRRGEKSIVTVELVPNTPAKKTQPPEKLVEQPPGADTTRLAAAYSESTRKPLIDRIRSLPSSSLADAGLNPTKTLFDRSIVNDPPKIKGIDAWSIERLVGTELAIVPNRDRTMFAAQNSTPASDGYLRIFDPTGKLKTAIPVPGYISIVRWSKAANDLIAVSSWVGQLDTSNPNQTAVTVWQVTGSGARLLRTIRCSNRSFNWDAGYRIISFIDEHLSATRIDTGKSWKLSENTEREFLYPDAISPNGRFVATYSVAENAQISVWDLYLDELRMAIPYGTGFRWSSDSERIAVDTRIIRGSAGGGDLTALEIWNVETCEMIKSFPKKGSGKSIIDADLRTIATQSKDGVVFLTDTMTRRQKRFQIPAEFIRENKRRFSIGWNRNNQLKIWTETASMVLNHLESGNKSPIELVESVPFVRPPAAQFELTDFQLKENRLDIFGLTNPIAGDQAFRVRLDLSNNQITETTKFSSLRSPQTRFSESPFKRNGMPTLVSPNGKFVLTWAQKASRSRSSSKMQNLQVVNLETPDKPLSIMDISSTSISEEIWSKDGCHLIVRSNDWRSSDGQTKIVDLKNWNIRDVGALRNKTIASVHEWNNGFVFRELMGRSRLGKRNSKIGFLSNDPDARFEYFDSVFSTVSFLEFSETGILLRGTLADEILKKPSAEPLSRFFKLSTHSADLKLEEVPEPETVSSIEPSNQYYSFDRKYRVEYQTKTNAAGLRNVKHVIFRSEKPETEVYVYKHGVDLFNWHPNANAAHWRENVSDWMFIAPDQQSVPKRVAGIRFSAPLENGWLIATAQTIRQVDFQGNTIAELSFDQNEAGEISNPIWILADGSVIGNHDSLHITYEADDQIKTEPLAEFSNRSAKSDLPQIAEGRLEIRPIIVQPAKD